MTPTPEFTAALAKQLARYQLLIGDGHYHSAAERIFDAMPTLLAACPELVEQIVEARCKAAEVLIRVNYKDYPEQVRSAVVGINLVREARP